jgi:hypothetical protein
VGNARVGSEESGLCFFLQALSQPRPREWQAKKRRKDTKVKQAGSQGSQADYGHDPTPNAFDQHQANDDQDYASYGTGYPAGCASEKAKEWVHFCLASFSHCLGFLRS